jgi:hypothetical protein
MVKVPVLKSVNESSLASHRDELKKQRSKELVSKKEI